MTRGKGSPDKPEESGFASRWSRLKQTAKSAPEAVPEAPLEAMPEAGAIPAEDPRSDAEVLADLGLPDPEALKPGDDFSAFMAKAVPTRIRNRALRRLWLSNPLLSSVDLLVDYGEDYSDAATVIENLQTSYQVGKGFADKFREIAGKEPEEADGGGGTGAADGDAPADSEAEPDPVEPEPAELEPTEPEPAEPARLEALPEARAGAAPDLAPPPRRRMRFRLAED